MQKVFYAFNQFCRKTSAQQLIKLMLAIFRGARLRVSNWAAAIRHIWRRNRGSRRRRCRCRQRSRRLLIAEIKLNETNASLTRALKLLARREIGGERRASQQRLRLLLLIAAIRRHTRRRRRRRLRRCFDENMRAAGASAIV